MTGLSKVAAATKERKERDTEFAVEASGCNTSDSVVGEGI